MFDIHCPHCGESYDQDYLHHPGELGGPEHLSYKQAARAFTQYGCGLFQERPAECKQLPLVPPHKLTLIRAAQEWSNHPDEWALLL